MRDPAETPTTDFSEAAELALDSLRQPPLAPVWITFAAVLIDAPILAVAFWFAQYAILPVAAFSPLSAALLAAAASIGTVLSLIATSSYAPRIFCSPLRALGRLAAAFAAPVAAMLLVLDREGADTAAIALLCLAAAAVPLRFGEATILGWVCKGRLLDRRAVIAGGGEHALALIRGLKRSPGNHVRVFGIFDDRDEIRSPAQVLGVPKLGGYQDLLAFARRAEIDMVIVALPLEAEKRITWLLETLEVLPVEVRLSAFSRDYTYATSGQMPLVAAIRRSFSPECRLTKRLFDLTFASLALVLATPVMLAAAIAVRLDSPGPILFRQRRHGYNDRVIEVLKFRSMHADQSDPDARRVVTRGDPRVTRVGRFLRRSSIDELPQLFNVLRGDLSLVGPRPHALDAMSSDRERFARIVKGYSARHRLPPGITGWAQIHGWRGEIDEPGKLRARFEHDLHYIENWSIWLDLQILLRTPLSLLNTRWAY